MAGLQHFVPMDTAMTDLDNISATILPAEQATASAGTANASLSIYASA